jgi:hypothetical protein
VVFVAIGMVAALHNEIGNTIVIDPDAPAVIVPATALYAFRARMLAFEPDITVGIHPAHIVLVMSALATDCLVCL